MAITGWGLMGGTQAWGAGTQSVTMISPQEEVAGTFPIPALKVVVPAVTKDQCLSESMAWVSSFHSRLERSMRVVVTKRVKMEGNGKEHAIY